jgi:hypothetical protein
MESNVPLQPIRKFRWQQSIRGIVGEVVGKEERGLGRVSKLTDVTRFESPPTRHSATPFYISRSLWMYISRKQGQLVVDGKECLKFYCVLNNFPASSVKL